MIQATGSFLFASYLGRSASILENGWGIFSSLKEGNWGSWKNIFDGIKGGKDNNVIGCISELGVDLATMALPMPLQIGLNLTRSVGEFFIGKDPMDAAMYAAQGLSGGDMGKLSSTAVSEFNAIKGMWTEGASKVANLKDIDYKPLVSHISSRAGTLAGNVYKQLGPWLDMFIKAAKPAYRAALAAV